MMANVIFGLCALTSAVCAILLYRAYRSSQARLLFWSALCFAGLALNNILLIVDVRIVPNIDLSSVRLIPAVIGMMLLTYGLVWETR